MSGFRVRGALQEALRDKIAGPDREETGDRIWKSQGDRWFDRADPIWRVHTDAAMFAGGVRALLLQSLHPLAMYGVAEHSGYRDDPWARVQSTGAYLAETTFGTIEHAEQAIAKVRRIHTFVTGTTPDGRPYAASDPHLLLWVHAAQVDSFLSTYQAFSRQPLDPDEADRYVAQCGVPAQLLGVVEPPDSVAALQDTIDRFRPELGSTAPAIEAARLVLREPPLAWWGRPVYDRLSAAAVATLPEWARRMIGVRARRFAVPLGRATTGAVSWVLAEHPADQVANVG